MINVFCLWVGNKYSLEYVTKLHNMVKENLTLDHQFICLTDKPHLHKIEGIQFIQAPVAIIDSWCKLSLFVPQLEDSFQGKALYLDLDVVITNKLDKIVKEADTKKFTIIDDWWRPTYNSSIMIWEMGKWNKIYTKFKPSDMVRLKGDQDLISEVLDESEVNTFGKIDVQSYKANKLAEKFNPQTKIVVFHGKPKPHQVDGWVNNYWK
jgi:lipopolysaccharide biosynthesis glycosyltransferase|tara:strand:+ start:3049 stop:3672 length:624 start_codon:yes stop_codon:yes gene_type:complete